MRKQRIYGRRAKAVDALLARPTIIEKDAAGLIPQVAVNRGAAGGGAAGKIFGAIAIAYPSATGADCALQAEQQTVQIDRNDLGCVDRSQRSQIREPSRAKIPSALGCGSDLPIDLSRLPLRRLRLRDVLAIRIRLAAHRYRPNND